MTLYATCNFCGEKAFTINTELEFNSAWGEIQDQYQNDDLIVQIQGSIKVFRNLTRQSYSEAEVHFCTDCFRNVLMNIFSEHISNLKSGENITYRKLKA